MIGVSSGNFWVLDWKMTLGCRHEALARVRETYAEQEPLSDPSSSKDHTQRKFQCQLWPEIYPNFRYIRGGYSFCHRNMGAFKNIHHVLLRPPVYDYVFPPRHFVEEILGTDFDEICQAPSYMQTEHG
ncbi:hypothetical protein Tco_1369689 [Tanacetum coccineum]